MTAINQNDIKLMESQRLDDTDQGGGQMTSNQVEDAAINNLFPDISRLDRVYGRVSLRTAYASVQTLGRQSYGGAHVIMTRQTEDPNVSVCFFSSKNWFDVRKEHQDRMEAYLVKGPQFNGYVSGNLYAGTRNIYFITDIGVEVPEIGDVFILKNSVNEQYCRIVDIDSSIITAINNQGSP